MAGRTRNDTILCIKKCKPHRDLAGCPRQVRRSERPMEIIFKCLWCWFLASVGEFGGLVGRHAAGLLCVMCNFVAHALMCIKLMQALKSFPHGQNAVSGRGEEKFQVACTGSGRSQDRARPLR